MFRLTGIVCAVAFYFSADSAHGWPTPEFHGLFRIEHATPFQGEYTDLVVRNRNNEDGETDGFHRPASAHVLVLDGNVLLVTESPIGPPKSVSAQAFEVSATDVSRKQGHGYFHLPVEIHSSDGAIKHSFERLTFELNLEGSEQLVGKIYYPELYGFRARRLAEQIAGSTVRDWLECPKLHCSPATKQLLTDYCDRLDKKE